MNLTEEEVEGVSEQPCRVYHTRIVEVARLGTGKNSVLGGSKAMGTMESKD